MEEMHANLLQTALSDYTEEELVPPEGDTIQLKETPQKANRRQPRRGNRQQE
jgi:hypothetical protein